MTLIIGSASRISAATNLRKKHWILFQFHQNKCNPYETNFGWIWNCSERNVRTFLHNFTQQRTPNKNNPFINQNFQTHGGTISLNQSLWLKLSMEKFCPPPLVNLWSIFFTWVVEEVLNGGELKNVSDPVSGGLSYRPKFALLCFLLCMDGKQKSGCKGREGADLLKINSLQETDTAFGHHTKGG